MSMLSYDKNLVRDPTEVRLLSRTHTGMAHFAGTGPEGTTCRECFFWQSRMCWTESNGGGVGQPMPSACWRFKQLTGAKKSDTIPHDTPSCKHFQQSVSPQPMKRPLKEWEA